MGGVVLAHYVNLGVHCTTMDIFKSAGPDILNTHLVA
jgi:hypothetical protein